jgi:hypothetical protein
MKKKVLLIFSVFIFGIGSSVYAQDTGGNNDIPTGELFGTDPPTNNEYEEDGPAPPPTAPINDYLPLLLLAGIGIGLFRTQQKSNTN